MSRFTVILEYKGGTYGSQVSAKCPDAALAGGVSKLKAADLKELGLAKTELTDIVRSDKSSRWLSKTFGA